MLRKNVALVLGALAFAIVLAGCSHGTPKTANPVEAFPGEVNLTNIRQLTFGGTNAEAYWSFDGENLSFQRKVPGIDCDQIFTMRADGSDLREMSNGQGRTT